MFPPKGYDPKYQLASEDGDHILTDSFCKFLTAKGYEFKVIAFPELRPNIVCETVRAPLFAKYRKVIEFHNADGKLVALLHRYGLTDYVERFTKGRLDLTLDFPDALVKMNVLLGSEPFPTYGD